MSLRLMLYDICGNLERRGLMDKLRITMAGCDFRRLCKTRNKISPYLGASHVHYVHKVHYSGDMSAVLVPKFALSLLRYQDACISVALAASCRSFVHRQNLKFASELMNSAANIFVFSALTSHVERPLFSTVTKSRPVSKTKSESHSRATNKS